MGSGARPDTSAPRAAGPRSDVVGPRDEALACSLPGSVPEWPKGADCKSAGIAYGGSNPPRPTFVMARASRTSRALIGVSGRQRLVGAERHQKSWGPRQAGIPGPPPWRQPRRSRGLGGRAGGRRCRRTPPVGADHRCRHQLPHVRGQHPAAGVECPVGDRSFVAIAYRFWRPRLTPGSAGAKTAGRGGPGDVAGHASGTCTVDTAGGDGGRHGG
jgi:hypothetical protein